MNSELMKSWGWRDVPKSELNFPVFIVVEKDKDDIRVGTSSWWSPRLDFKDNILAFDEELSAVKAALVFANLYAGQTAHAAKHFAVMKVDADEELLVPYP